MLKEGCSLITEVKTKVYAGRLKDRASLLRSSSGGAFVVLSDYFLIMMMPWFVLCTIMKITPLNSS